MAKKKYEDVVEEVEVGPAEWVNVPAKGKSGSSFKPEQKKMTVSELLMEVDKYKAICECTNVCSVSQDGRTLVLS